MGLEDDVKTREREGGNRVREGRKKKRKTSLQRKTKSPRFGRDLGAERCHLHTVEI